MRAVVYDGFSAQARPVTAVFGDATLTLTSSDGTTDAVPGRLLRRGARGQMVHRRDLPDWRLAFDAPVPPWVAHLPDLGRPSRTAMRVYGGVIAAALTIAAVTTWFGDDLLTAAVTLVPSRIARPIGDAVIASLGAPRCTGAAGSAALDRLVARLRPAKGFGEPVSVSVVDTAAVNAVTAPGGRVVIFRGLIDQAVSPDEVAGVLAHELSHVALRHPEKSLIRQLGVSLIVRALGGDVGNAVDLVGLLRSSRQAERAADAGALDLLRAAHISPAGLAGFFVRMQRDEAAKSAADDARRVIDLAMSFTATHPGENERAAAISAAMPRAGEVTPALSTVDWQALRGICSRNV